MVAPAVLLVGAGALAVTGVANGIRGVQKMSKARGIGHEAEQRHKAQLEVVRTEEALTSAVAEEYGVTQLRVATETVARLVDFIERNARKASVSELEFLEGVNVSVAEFERYRAMAGHASGLLSGASSAVGAAIAAQKGALALVGLFGAASTGTAISSLSGAAAWKATLAYLGGGPLAAGGGGMALGSIVLGGITVGPAIAIGGFALNGVGEKSLTKAHEYQAKVEAAVAEMQAFCAYLGQVRTRVGELSGLLKELDIRARAALDRLETQPFDPHEHAPLFQEAALEVKALVEIIKTPVLDKDGDLNPAALTVIAKYKPASPPDPEELTT